MSYYHEEKIKAAGRFDVAFLFVLLIVIPATFVGGFCLGRAPIEIKPIEIKVTGEIPVTGSIPVTGEIPVCVQGELHCHCDATCKCGPTNEPTPTPAVIKPRLLPTCPTGKKN